jgi:hypothetical protein
MQLGYLTSQLDALQEKGAELFKEYENDADLADLKERASEIRALAAGLVDGFDTINSGLAQL